MNLKINRVLLAYILLSGIVGGLVGGFVANKINSKEQSINDRIKSYYDDETSVLVSPTTIKKKINDKDDSYILVDLRSSGEYQKEHIVGAINIPAGVLSKEETVKEFQKLPKDKEIIVHCYSASCMLGRQTGKLLSENGIYVKELGIGWSEWRYYWPLWNPGAKDNDGEKYIEKGDPDVKVLPAPCENGELNC